MIDTNRVFNKIFKIFFGLIVTGALFWVLFVLFSTPKTDSVVLEGFVLGGRIDIPVSIADTDEEREEGLSNTDFLDKNTGKFFIFDTADQYGFWMKDMNYSLDLVWIDEDMTIVQVSQNISPDTYPNVFYPSQKVKYVLEINAGEAEKNKLSTGTKLRLHSK
jgi:uncharacterized membrane protein (UPF0127 family)